ncbi:hypothetical protein COM35_23345 [Bacillus toyonensis]|nr:hypothetical protein COM35_23345 [Bacillus toyonensis]
MDVWCYPILYGYSFLLCCVTQKRKCYEAINIKGCNVWLSYTKYKIWVSGSIKVSNGVYT